MLQRTMAAAAFALAVVTATQTAAAAEQADQSAVPCPSGYVCLQPAATPGVRPILVRQGETRSFPDGLPVSSVSNQTLLNYCVSAQPFNYWLAPGSEAVRAHVVRAVGPYDACAA
ncbi:hypothetical protein [Nonomuraea sp. B12E4]|uniref:hypothetical protein n=1 Tax=Nonomuraea sp. B12E4 TaxID=3153564 RepID=UPI00325F9F0C